MTDLFDWSRNPGWAQEGGEHFDGNWTHDCQGKEDYDPGLFRICARVYADGMWIASLYAGAETEVECTGLREAGTKDAAKRAVEEWALETATALQAASSRVPVLERALARTLDGLDSIAGDRTPELFPETSYDCARRIAKDARQIAGH